MSPIFDYKAMDAAGKFQKGRMEAENQKIVRLKLKKQGLILIQMHEKTSAAKSERLGMRLAFLTHRVSVTELTAFTRQLASLVKANIPLVEALSALVDQTENERLKVILEEVRQAVNEGSSLASAVKMHPRVFDTIFINMIEAGEASGTLGLVLLRLADLKESQSRLRSKILSSMAYPIVMMVFAFCLMIGIFMFVIPKLTSIFDSMNVVVPPLTRFFMVLSHFIVERWFFIILGGVLFFSLFQRYIHSQVGRPKWDAFLLKLPVIGQLIRIIAVTRFANTMAILLSSGVPILTSMTIAKNLVENVPIANAIANARANITEGQSIAEPLRRSGEFPPMMIHMIAVGEKTGELPNMLQNIAHTYEEQVNVKIGTLTSLLEPLMIIGMGGAVGMIVLSVFLPLMDMMNMAKR